jgi:hypothetical protein
VLWVSVRNDARYDDRGDGPEPFNNLLGLVEPPQMRVAGREIPLRYGDCGSLLQRREQHRCRIVEPPTEKIRGR